MAYIAPTGSHRYGYTQRFLSRAISARQRAFTLFELLIVIAIVGIVAAFAWPNYQRYVDSARVASAEADIRVIETTLERYYIEKYTYPDTLSAAGVGGMRDPWGNPYRYLHITATTSTGSLRKDRNLVPINSDYDLYSMGKDGVTQAPLTAAPSRDDVIRASNGKFIGLAANY